MNKSIIALLFIALLSLPVSADSDERPQRIVSLAPNMTELLFALGLGDKIVGVTSFCDFPEEAKKKPKVGGMSNPSLEAVVSLKPDLVVMSIDGNPKEFEERLRSLNIRTYVFRTKRIGEFARGVKELGKVLGVGGRAEAFADDIEKALDRHRRSAPGKTKRVLFIIWPEPLIVAGPGSITDDALNLLGQKNIAASAKSAYPKYSIEEVIRSGPDIIFIGKGEGMDKVSKGLLGRLKSVPAVKSGRVFLVSDRLYRLTPRTVDGLEELSYHIGRAQ